MGSDECAARLAAGAGFIISGCCIGLCSLPMIIAYHIFTYDNPDPEHCWVIEGGLEAYAEAPGQPGELDMAAEWRHWFKVMFWMYTITASLPCLAGICAFGAPYTIPGAICMYVGFGCGAVAKGGIFWWGVFMRFRDQGRVASGNMISDCVVMSSFNSTAEVVAVDAADPADDEMRRLTTGTDSSDTIFQPTEMDCKPDDVFQVKSGKFFIAIICLAILGGII